MISCTYTESGEFSFSLFGQRYWYRSFGWLHVFKRTDKTLQINRYKVSS